MLLATGTYIGNGADNRSIAGIGFEPDFVMLFKNAAESKLWRTNSGFSGDQTTTFGSTTGTFANGIQALEADGFQVGSHSVSNASGATYYWIAVQDDGGGDFAVGNYIGNGIDNRDVEAGLQPKYMFLKRIDGGGTYTEMRIDTMANNESWVVGTGLSHGNHIQDFGATSFQIGTAAGVNTSGGTYAWIAFGYGATGNYLGNGLDDRDITGSGFTPAFNVVKEDSTSQSRAKIPDSVIGEGTLRFSSNAGLGATNEIQSLIADGFQVGTDSDVNANGVNYHWFTTKDNPISGGTIYEDNLAFTQVLATIFNPQGFLSESLVLSKSLGQGLNHSLLSSAILALSLTLDLAEISTLSAMETLNLDQTYDINWATDIDITALWVNITKAKTTTWVDITQQGGLWKTLL